MANWIVNKNSDGTGTVHRDGVLIAEVMRSGDADEQRYVWHSVYSTVSAAFADAPPATLFMCDAPAAWRGSGGSIAPTQPEGGTEMASVEAEAQEAEAQAKHVTLRLVRGDNWKVGYGKGITGPTAIGRKLYGSSEEYDDLPISVPDIPNGDRMSSSVVAWIPERPGRNAIAQRIVAAMRYCRGMTTAELERRAPPPAPAPVLVSPATPTALYAKCACGHAQHVGGSGRCVALDCGCQNFYFRGVGVGTAFVRDGIAALDKAIALLPPAATAAAAAAAAAATTKGSCPNCGGTLSFGAGLIDECKACDWRGW